MFQEEEKSLTVGDFRVVTLKGRRQRVLLRRPDHRKRSNKRKLVPNESIQVPPGDLLFIFDRIGKQKVECFHVFVLKLKHSTPHWKLEIDYENSVIVLASNNVDIQPESVDITL